MKTVHCFFALLCLLSGRVFAAEARPNVIVILVDAHFNRLQEALAPERKDLGTWCDLHDLDDCVTFGGRP